MFISIMSTWLHEPLVILTVSGEEWICQDGCVDSLEKRLSKTNGRTLIRKKYFAGAARTEVRYHTGYRLMCDTRAIPLRGDFSWLYDF